MDRALVSGTRGRAFESRIAHHNKNKGLHLFRRPFFIVLLLRIQPYVQPPVLFSVFAELPELKTKKEFF